MKLTQDLYMVGSGQIGLSHALDCHTYLLDTGAGLICFDAGAGREPERIIANIRADGLSERDVAYILLTHSHADHAGGASALKALSGGQIACSEIEGRLLAEGSDEELGLLATKRSGVYPQDYVYAHIEPDRILQPEETLHLGRYTLRTIQVPGHSPGSLCFLLDDGARRILIAGDTVFFGGTIGLGNWAGSDLAAYRQHIGRLAGLGVEILLPGHFLWTLVDGQSHLDQAVGNLQLAWVPPAWQHQHPHH
jgi:hydroxyacylglutathione hydrolase